MKTKRNICKKLAWLSIALVLGISTNAVQAANLTGVSDGMTGHAPNQTITHVIKFTPVSSITAPGDLKIIFPSGFDLSSVSAAADVTVSGGNVTWAAVAGGDLNVGTRTFTLNWSSGTLTPGNQVTVTINFVKNPSSTGNYNLTIQVGPDGFSTATDSRVIPLVIVNSGINVSATVPAAQTNPTITNTPAGTTVISSGGSQTLSFTLTDANNDNIDYTVTPSTGNISVAPSPASPVTGTQSGVSVTFTYFANGATGAQTITVTADDNEATGGGLVTYDIQLFII